MIMFLLIGWPAQVVGPHRKRCIHMDGMWDPTTIEARKKL